MKHLGDITKINGADVPIVDIVTGGSPCQDLSVAGKRAGLDGERSGLFMEQVRVFKEMRDECIRQLRMRGSDVNVRSIRPRFFVWENVPGAFSSNKGEDFRAVLEEVCRIADKDASIPMPEKGKWSTSGCIMGDGYSVAWRVHDAQFWGVPQRRKRISLVADFGGSSAPEILFERKGLSGDITESGEQRQGVTASSERNFDKAISFQERAGCEGGARESLSNTNEQEPCQRLTTNQCLNSWDVQSKHIQPEDGIAECLYSGEKSWGGGQSYVMAYGISAYESNAMKSSNPHSGIYEADTTRTLDNNGGNPACNQGGMVIVEGFDGYNTTPTGEVSKTITSGRNDTHNLPIVLEGNGSRPSHQGDGYKESEVSYTLNSVEQHAVCWDGGQISPTLTANNAGGGQRMPDKDNFNAVITYGIDRASFNQGKNAQYNFQVQEEIAQTIVAKGPGGGVLTHK